jgi:agmatine deiminase
MKDRGKRRVFAFLLLIGLLMPTRSQAELIVLAAPVSDDIYYSEVADGIFDFHIAYAKAILKHDQVLVLTDAGAYQRYADALGSDAVLVFPMLDIWARDFGSANPSQPTLFRYTAAGQGGGRQGQDDADAVQHPLVKLANDADLSFLSTQLLNDGGNFVDDYAGNVVVSRKFLHDNDLSEEEGRIALSHATGARYIAFITADEQGGLEHADGVVSFVDTNTLIINAYPEDPAYARQLRRDLEDSLPGVSIHEVVTPYDGSSIYDERFGSACGLYTNALVTPDRIYFPQFGIPEDALALSQVRAATSREVIPVRSDQVCQMGGGVRCMSWQLRGANADALLSYARTQR